MIDRYRDPVHGFIEVTKLESAIINSPPFQRLRNIKQLALTNYVFHGAEHTRFGHSLGVMHLVTKAFNSAIKNSEAGAIGWDNKKIAWYEQILRLIALIHDLGHAPFSHASEEVFSDNLMHEDFTEKIVTETCIAKQIEKIGKDFKEKHGEDYDITPRLICDIYLGKNPGENNEFTLLKSFMDSELDCDKMDYLLRDSLFCGVTYGKYDIDRLISSLMIIKNDGENFLRLAINDGGIQAFEAFVLARYFMFIQVYFHRTRRYFDIILVRALKNILPSGKYPSDVKEFLKWDDSKVFELIKENYERVPECKWLVDRIVCPCVFDTKAHPEYRDKVEFDTIRKNIYEKIGEEECLIDTSAEKLPHKIPIKTNVKDEKAVLIKHKNKTTTISTESHIIQALTYQIDIKRIYVNPEKREEAEKICYGC